MKYDENIAQARQPIDEIDAQIKNLKFFQLNKKTALNNSRLEYEDKLQAMANEKNEELNRIQKEIEYAERNINTIGAKL